MMQDAVNGEVTIFPGTDIAGAGAPAGRRDSPPGAVDSQIQFRLLRRRGGGVCAYRPRADGRR